MTKIRVAIGPVWHEPRLGEFSPWTHRAEAWNCTLTGKNFAQHSYAIQRARIGEAWLMRRLLSGELIEELSVATLEESEAYLERWFAYREAPDEVMREWIESRKSALMESLL